MPKRFLAAAMVTFLVVRYVGIFQDRYRCRVQMQMRKGCSLIGC